MLEEQQGGQCGGNRVSKGQIDTRGDREVTVGQMGAFVRGDVGNHCRVLSRMTDLTYFLK